MRDKRVVKLGVIHRIYTHRIRRLNGTLPLLQKGVHA